MDLEKLREESERRRKEWTFRATIYHDIELGPETWTVDGVAQDLPLTEENLFEAVNSKAPAKPVVTVGAPMHLVMGRITGFLPPYKHVAEAR